MRHLRPPTEITMQMVQDPDLWREASRDGPVDVDAVAYDAIRSKPGAHPDDLLDEPGVKLKAGFDGTRHGFRFYGRLVKFKGDPLRWRTAGYDEVYDEVVVIATLDKETVWLGTVDQYHTMWCVD